MFKNISLRRFAPALLVGSLAIAALAPAASVSAEKEQASFDLVVANPKLLPCLAKFPDNPNKPPTAHVSVERGDLNDTLKIQLENIKPDLAFDMFTVQRTNKLANGQPDPAFTNFGLAWYQSDLEVNDNGRGNAQIKTILLDQIFGFDPDVSLQPLNTFHVGFWFNNPDDAAGCVGQVVTPFNGEHHAGPLAMISLPDANGLGPLCRNENLSTTPASCNP